MSLNALDWALVVGFFAATLLVGFLFKGRAGRSIADYFLSGRNLPWWLAGTSMVATTFAADTPLAVTGLIVAYGLAGNWVWWAFALGGMFTVFVYAKLWRRSGVVTDVELVELRYGGKPAKALRGFRAAYIALVVNPIIIGWVTGAMITVLGETVLYQVDGRYDWLIIVACLAVVGVYGAMSGLWGVVVTDMFQFVLAMGGCIALAIIAVNHLGGIEAMQAKAMETSGAGEQLFSFFPSFTVDDPWMPLHIFMVLLLVQWWATWYPGAEPGGGGYVVQRMASCKDEKNAVLATLWFQIAHYCVRPWPWLLVAFCAVAMYPELSGLEEPGAGYAWVIRDVAPHGVYGLILVTFFAAFMSTLSTQMNWGASYLVRDIYQRMIRPDADERELTRASRIASILVLVEGGIFAWLMRSVSVADAWQILMALGAGTGAVFMLRWFWWRINAWSEISAMVGSLVFFLVLSPFIKTQELKMAAVAGLTILLWLLVTMLTPAENLAVLQRFYRKVRPGGPGWGPVARSCPEVVVDRGLGLSVIQALVAAVLLYSVLAGVGYTIFGQWLLAGACVAIAGTTGGILAWSMRLGRTDIGAGPAPDASTGP